MGWFSDFVDTVADTAGDIFGTVNDAVLSPVINSVIKPAVGTVGSVLKPVVGTVAQVGTTLFNAGKTVVNDQYKFIRGTQDAVLNIGNGVGNLFDSPMLLIGGGLAVALLIMVMSNKK